MTEATKRLWQDAWAAVAAREAARVVLKEAEAAVDAAWESLGEPSAPKATWEARIVLVEYGWQSLGGAAEAKMEADTTTASWTLGQRSGVSG